MRLKRAAQRLFALRGFEGVTVQEIVSLAEQKNKASLHYYFGSKEALAEELIIDGASAIDALRLEHIESIHAAGAQDRVASWIDALAYPLMQYSGQDGEFTYIRMVTNFQLNRRDFLRQVIGTSYNKGYRLCNENLTRLQTALAPTLLQQRISMVGIFGSAILATWEAVQDSKETDRFWSDAYSLDHVLDSLQAMFEAPVGERTQRYAMSGGLGQR